MNNEYIPVKGFEKYYLVNKQGDIFSLRSKRTIKYYKDKDGYLRVRLYGKDKSIWIGVHKVVALTFLENPNNYTMVNHKNFKRDDNRVDNLQWCSAKENVQWSLPHYKGTNFMAVIRKDFDGNIIKYQSIMDAARENKLPAGNICKCCKGIRKSAGNFMWMYA